MAQLKQIIPNTSGTIAITDSGTDVQVIHTGALSLTLTLTFPATPFDGQVVSLASANGITTLTCTTPVGSIINAISTLVAGTTGYFMYDAANTKWYKV